MFASLLPRCDDFWPLVFGYTDEDNNKKSHISGEQDRPPQSNTDSDTDFRGETDSDELESSNCIHTSYTFINEINGYTGCTDTQLQQRYPNEARFSDVDLIASRLTDAGYPYTSKSQILIRMNGIFGYSANQIPLNAKITKASLTMFTTDATLGDITIHRMFANWNKEITWNTLGGVTPDDEEAAIKPENSTSNPGIAPSFSFDVTKSLNLWQTDPSQNRGWVIINNSDDAWHTLSCETDLEIRRPRLDVEVCGIRSNQPKNLPPEIFSSADSQSEDLYASASALLDVVVLDPDANPMDVAFYGREKGTEFWTIILLPDTQYYTVDAEWPKGIFTGQTQWIVDNREALNIKAVLSLGDLVEIAAVPEHWTRANEALSTIIDAGIPYMPTPGDHDHDNQWEDGNLIQFSNTFPESRFSDNPWWGDVYDGTNSSHYMLLTLGLEDYIFLGLDFCPDADELAWANDILDIYADRKAVFTTHALMDDTGGYYATTDCGRFNAESFFIWEEFVSRHDNLTLALSGHMHLGDGEYQRTDDNVNGVPVHLVVSDYQMRLPDWGNGLLRIMTFFPFEDEIRVQTYSTYYNTFETDEDSQFTLSYDMEDNRPFMPIANISDISNGSHATHFWTGLEPGTTYEWYAVVNDGTLEIQSPVWEFTTTAKTL